jgi:hypothetical protein
MGLPKKGLRTIEVEGKRYGWLIRKKPTYSQGVFECAMAIGIQELDCETPKVLHVLLNISRPDNWIQEHKTAITPAIVENIIRSAKENGWACNDGGSPFEFKYSVHANL